MTKLLTSPRFPDSDAAFRALVEAHRGLTPAQSVALNAQLVLLLANHVGDIDILHEALCLAASKPEAKG